MRVVISLVLSLFLFYACGGTDKKGNESSAIVEELTGEWRNVYIKIDTYSKNNTDSSEVLEVGADQWQEKLKIKLIRTIFRADSSWNSPHYNLNDSMVFNPSGKWWISGDSLVFQQLFPSAEINSYKVTLKGDTATFEAMYDWDMDGKRDDHYFGRQVRVSAK